MNIPVLFRKPMTVFAILWLIGIILVLIGMQHMYTSILRRKVKDTTITRDIKWILSPLPQSEEIVAEKDQSILYSGLKNDASNDFELFTHKTFDRNLREKKLPYTQASTPGVYMFSAVQFVRTQTLIKLGGTVVVNGWEKKELYNLTNTCCYYHNNGSVLSVYLKKKILTFNEYLRPLLYVCPSVINFSHLKGVSISLENKCSRNEVHYIKPVLNVDRIEPKIGVCAKMTFGSANAKQILEWFEVQRLLGVSKVLTYTYQLNIEALKVLKYYESIGFANVVYDFDFPEKDNYQREVGGHNARSWSDLQVVMNDCFLRLFGYKYVMVLDKDEFMIPNIVKYGFDLKSFLDFHFKENVAAITMQTRFHMMSWKPSNTSSQLYLGKYVKSTAAVNDRLKNIFIPTRVYPGKVKVHHVRPHGQFRRKRLASTEIALHHYRECRQEPYDFQAKNMTARQLTIIYENKDRKRTCANFRQYDCPDIERVIQAVESNVLKLERELNLIT